MKRRTRGYFDKNQAAAFCFLSWVAVAVVSTTLHAQEMCTNTSFINVTIGVTACPWTCPTCRRTCEEPGLITPVRNSGCPPASIIGECKENCEATNDGTVHALDIGYRKFSQITASGNIIWNGVPAQQNITRIFNDSLTITAGGSITVNTNLYPHSGGTANGTIFLNAGIAITGSIGAPPVDPNSKWTVCATAPTVALNNNSPEQVTILQGPGCQLGCFGSKYDTVTEIVNFSDSCILDLVKPAWEGKKFSDGSRLEVTCDFGGLVDFLPSYKMWYTNPSGERRRIAQCIFSGGTSLAQIKYVKNADLTPRCLLEARWENVDAYENDGRKAVDDFVFTTALENFLDVVTYTFDANKNKLSWRNDKFPYPEGTTTVSPGEADRIASTSPLPGKTWTVDPEVGDTTERLFDGLMVLLQKEVRRPMTFGLVCDLNFDGHCDQIDQRAFSLALATCRGQAGFTPRADVDRDGCVTEVDQTAWLESFSYYTTGCTRSLGYWKTHATAWPHTAITLGGRQYDKAEVLRILNEPVKANGLVSLSHQLIASKLNVASGALAIAATISTADALVSSATQSEKIPPTGKAYVAPSTAAPYAKLLEDYNEGRTPPWACPR